MDKDGGRAARVHLIGILDESRDGGSQLGRLGVHVAEGEACGGGGGGAVWRGAHKDVIGFL